MQVKPLGGVYGDTKGFRGRRDLSASGGSAFGGERILVHIHAEREPDAVAFDTVSGEPVGVTFGGTVSGFIGIVGQPDGLDVV